MKRFICIFILLFVLASAVACAADDSLPVMLSHGEGVTVLGQNPVRVTPGDDVTFQVELDDGYIFFSASDGKFDVDTGTLTVKNVSERMNISFYAEKVDFDTSKEAVFFLEGAAGDSDNVDGFNVKLGSSVTVRSNNFDSHFLGWSFGKRAEKGGKIVSTERSYDFRVTPDILSGGVLRVYANYSDASYTVYRYDANGGTVNSGSDNLAENEYYTAAQNGNTVTVTLSEKYYSFAASASTFYDDGTFTNEGYVLREYNTAPDGSGEAYSIGSKFYAGNSDGIATLYCIWEKETPHTDFTVSDYNYPRPVKEAYAPDWHSDGVIIEKYNGDAKTVAIPEKIGGKYVIAIRSGAFENKSLDTLVLNRHIQKIEDGAFISCEGITTVYYPDGIYSISNAAFDEESYTSFKHLYVNASIAPRFCDTGDGAFAVKLSKLLETAKEPQIIVISGSSSLEGLGSEYLEALFSGDYAVVNFGTTRTTHGLIYLEAMQHFADSDDIIIYAPENSIYMMGEREMYWKTLRDLEPLNNFFRYIDISNYTNVFSAFADFNQNYKYMRGERKYEQFVNCATSDKNGDYQRETREQYDYPNYIDAYFVTMNERYKSRFEGQWNSLQNQINNKDYTDPNNITWCSITEPECVSMVNHAIAAAKSSGAKVWFGFCPVDFDSLVEPARSLEWLAAYDTLIAELYDFDAVLGESCDYIWNRKYFYDCAFHMNDYGRTYRTYQLYSDIARKLGITELAAIDSRGTSFDGCIFEKTADGKPKFNVEFGGGAS